MSCVPESFSIDDAGPADVGTMDTGSDGGRQDAWRDSGSEPDALEPVDAAPDAAPSNNISVACPTPWNELGANPSGTCAGRRVEVVGAGLGPNDVDIALLESLDVALAWNLNDLFDSGGVELRVLNADTLEATRSATISPESPFGELAGYSISMVPEGDDVHLAYWVRRDDGSTIEYRRWSDVLSPAETISAQVGRSGTVSLGVSAGGDATFAIYDHITGRHFARTRLRGGELEASIPLAQDMRQIAFESTAISLVHLNGISHVVYRRRLGEDSAQPIYRRRAGLAAWSGTSTLDSATGSRHSGIALDMAASGDEIAVVYLDWASEQSEVRLARWHTTPDELELEILTTYGAAEAPTETPLDIEYDAFGLLHLLFSNDAGGRSLQYWRQMANGAGWLRDTIIELPPEAPLRARFVVGPSRQPHIVFAARGDIHYATITP